VSRSSVEGQFRLAPRYASRMATTSSRPPSPPPVPPSRVKVAAPKGGGTQRILDFLKRWAVPIIGGVTPVALIFINIAVWINDHVQSIAIWVAIAAFVSGMMFNSWIGLSIYRWVQRRWPQWSPVSEHNQEVMLVLGMGVITLVTFLTSLGLYIGLRDARGLPNAWTLWYGVIQIAYPFVLKIYVDRDGRRRGGVVASQPGDGQRSWAPPGRIEPPRPGDGGYGAEAARTGYRARPQPPVGSPPLAPPRQPPPGGGYLPPS
jgi:hypothetical protein